MTVSVQHPLTEQIAVLPRTWVRLIGEPEKMLTHQMAAVHKLVMEQMGQIAYEQNAQ
jgi:hypothetical protein